MRAAADVSAPPMLAPGAAGEPEQEKAASLCMANAYLVAEPSEVALLPTLAAAVLSSSALSMCLKPAPALPVIDGAHMSSTAPNAALVSQQKPRLKATTAAWLSALVMLHSADLATCRSARIPDKKGAVLPADVAGCAMKRPYAMSSAADARWRPEKRRMESWVITAGTTGSDPPAAAASAAPSPASAEAAGAGMKRESSAVRRFCTHFCCLRKAIEGRTLDPVAPLDDDDEEEAEDAALAAVLAPPALEAAPRTDGM